MHRLATVHVRDNQPTTNDQRRHDTACLNKRLLSEALKNLAITNRLHVSSMHNSKFRTISAFGIMFNYWYFLMWLPWPLVPLRYGERSFPVSGPTCWNVLPSELKLAASTLDHFCSRLKTKAPRRIFKEITIYLTLSKYIYYVADFCSKFLEICFIMCPSQAVAI